MHAPLVVIGDKLGLYKAMGDGRPVTSHELAARTGTNERYVREWLNAQSASGYVVYDPATARYFMTPEQAMLLANPDSPAFLIGAFETALAAAKIRPTLEQAFQTGEGVGWHQHDHALFHGVERFFRTSYVANLTTQWIPSLDGVEEKLHRGIHVADIACGHGASTILMAQAYPNSRFIGFDYHEDSILAARQRAKAAGVAGRVRFEVAPAKSFPGVYDFVTTFDALHDMGDPRGASAHVHSTLRNDGAWMIVEPFAGDRVEDNLHPIGRAYYSGSTMICTPCAMAQDTGVALGAQAGEARLRDMVTGGGFTRFRKAAESPFNLVLEARP
ncbi:MAG: methyltransferase domain-containing protein [Bryobacterales bacterium]|nr:methyltransferase domain-containing protein [Bryobacterales bacterium]